MKKTLSALYIIFVAVLIIGCEPNTSDQDNDVVCTAVIEPGIIVEIRDAITDEPLAENAIVVITDNDYTETLVISQWISSVAVAVEGAHERPGIYDIQLSLTGYNDWTRSGVEVRSGVCHVETVTISARLVKK